ncbi:MAG TPA: transporter substrate-binding domain-containing protein [Clostridiales bacterium]|nr:transporter substrate-binding domain-containing protein [Clostridiales bacterium]
MSSDNKKMTCIMTAVFIIFFLFLPLNAFAINTDSPKTLVLLGNENLAPIVYNDNGTVKGVAVDIAKAIGNEIGYDIEVMAVNWEQAQLMVLNGEADGLLQINPNPERNELFDFSRSLLKSDFSMFVRNGNAALRSIDDLKNKRVGVEAGGYPYTLLQRYETIDIEIIKDWTTSFKALSTGDLDAIIVDRWIGEYELANSRIADIKIVDPPIETQYSRIAVKKGDTETLSLINSGLKKITEDGTVDKIMGQWKGKRVIYITEDYYRTFFLHAAFLFLLVVLLVALYLVRKYKKLSEKLEISVQERTRELHKANYTLEASNDKLQLILDTAAEAIYGIDLDGNCTFCNRSCVKMLGYSDQSELLGKNMHRLIHHSRQDGTPISIDDCTILNTLIKGEGSHVEDEVFWRADGTFFYVEYFSYPQIKNGEITGAVITFLDISKRKQKEAEVEYLYCYDVLTGLYNRRCFVEYAAKMDIPENLPLSVIFADINGLKMTNDIFGHSAGDALIKKSSEILKQASRHNDVVARIGGDEFVILPPNTTKENAKDILARIKSGFAEARVEGIKCSISLGADTKRSPNQSLEEVMARAENAMYKDKTMNRSSINKDIIDTIIDTLHSKATREKQHSITVSELCSDLATALHLPETEISKLKRAAYLHDIGKIVLSEDLLVKDTLTDEEFEEMKQHSVVGYRILNLFDETLDLAEYVYGHHERWDGTGYPRGLKGEQIPMLSRIIAVTETYDRVLNRGTLPYEKRKLAALNVIKNGAGTQFDPQIAQLFAQMIEKEEASRES